MNKIDIFKYLKLSTIHMTTQINLKFQDGFFKLAQEFAQERGYMNIQELAREAIREKIFDNLEVSEEYKKRLQSKEANTFLSAKESKDFHKKLKKKAGL